MAARINAQLAECGFPLCRSEIMARNPRWCLSLGEWEETFSTWIDRGDPPSLLNAAIFFDFRAVCGNANPVSRLREWRTATARSNQRFLQQMARHDPLADAFSTAPLFLLLLERASSQGIGDARAPLGLGRAHHELPHWLSH